MNKFLSLLMVFMIAVTSESRGSLLLSDDDEWGLGLNVYDFEVKHWGLEKAYPKTALSSEEHGNEAVESHVVGYLNSDPKIKELRGNLISILPDSPLKARSALREIVHSAVLGAETSNYPYDIAIKTGSEAFNLKVDDFRVRVKGAVQKSCDEQKRYDELREIFGNNPSSSFLIELVMGEEEKESRGKDPFYESAEESWENVEIKSKQIFNSPSIKALGVKEDKAFIREVLETMNDFLEEKYEEEEFENPFQGKGDNLKEEREFDIYGEKEKFYPDIFGKGGGLLPDFFEKKPEINKKIKKKKRKLIIEDEGLDDGDVCFDDIMDEIPVNIPKKLSQNKRRKELGETQGDLYVAVADVALGNDLMPVLREELTRVTDGEAGKIKTEELIGAFFEGKGRLMAYLSRFQSVEVPGGFEDPFDDDNEEDDRIYYPIGGGEKQNKQRDQGDQEFARKLQAQLNAEAEERRNRDAAFALKLQQEEEEKERRRQEELRKRAEAEAKRLKEEKKKQERQLVMDTVCAYFEGLDSGRKLIARATWGNLFVRKTQAEFENYLSKPSHRELRNSLLGLNLENGLREAIDHIIADSEEKNKKAAAKYIKESNSSVGKLIIDVKLVSAEDKGGFNDEISTVVGNHPLYGEINWDEYSTRKTLKKFLLENLQGKQIYSAVKKELEYLEKQALDQVKADPQYMQYGSIKPEVKEALEEKFLDMIMNGIHALTFCLDEDD